MKRRIARILFFFFLSTALFGCNATPPEGVAVCLFHALTSGDMRYVKENIYFAKNLEYNVVCEYLDMAVNSNDYKTRTAGYKADYKAVNVTYEGDVAWVELRGESPMGKSIFTVARLLFIDGKWKVDGDYTVLHSYDGYE